LHGSLSPFLCPFQEGTILFWRRNSWDTIFIKPAVRNLAAQIIVAHNHPSGDPEPSEDDVEITKNLVESGKILGIDVVDYIIIKDGFLSFKEKNLI